MDSIADELLAVLQGHRERRPVQGIPPQSMWQDDPTWEQQSPSVEESEGSA